MDKTCQKEFVDKCVSTVISYFAAYRLCKTVGYGYLTPTYTIPSLRYYLRFRFITYRVSLT